MTVIMSGSVLSPALFSRFLFWINIFTQTMRNFSGTFSIILCALVAVAIVNASLGREKRKIEEMIPMRDGVKLHTLIFLPREDDGETKKYTAIVDRSPYGYGDMEWIPDLFLPFGYVAVGQDMRGTELSEGNFSMWMSDADDSRDLGDWIVAQEWSNGQIMTLGASADGIGSLQTPKTSPEWLKAQYIIWACPTMYQELIPYGTYKQKTAEDWLKGLTMPNPDVVYDNIETVHENEAHTDYWAGMELNETTYAKVNFPSAFWAGWYDLFQLGTFQAFEGYNEQSQASVQHTSVLTVDAAGHCLESGPFFTQNAVLGRTALVLAQMFELYGVRPVERTEVKNITFYVMSSNDTAGLEVGQYWTSLTTWPTYKSTDYYMRGDGSLSLSMDTSGTMPESSTYQYNPANPVPTMGGNNLPDSIGGSIPCGPLDQSVIDQRSDVLVFQTPVLGEGEELALTGPLFATLYVSSDAIDTDFMVRISDVFSATGEARLLQDNAVRMRWREGGLTPVYMSKGEVYEVETNLWNTSYILAPGHSLRVAVTSSNNPRFSVNPNNGILLADATYPGENITATNTLYHSATYPSKITLPVISDRHSQLPEVHVLREVQKAYPDFTLDRIKELTPVVENMLHNRKKH